AAADPRPGLYRHGAGGAAAPRDRRRDRRRRAGGDAVGDPAAPRRDHGSGPPAGDRRGGAKALRAPPRARVPARGPALHPALPHARLAPGRPPHLPGDLGRAPRENAVAPPGSALGVSRRTKTDAAEAPIALRRVSIVC